MTILALDTTNRRGSVALLRDGTLLEVRTVEAPEGFAGKLYAEIRGLLERNSVALTDVDCFAAAAGPGSFTGIRIGLTAAKSLAEVNGKKAVGISNLRAMAELGEGRFRAPVMDARRGEVFAAVFDEGGQAVVDEVVTPWPAFVDLVGGRDVTFISTETGLFGADGTAPLDSEGNGTGTAGHKTLDSPLAAGVARLAEQAMRSGEARDPEELDANYVRRPDAELNWKPPE